MEIPFFEGDTPVNHKLILMASAAFLAVSPAAFSMESDGEGGDGSSGRRLFSSSKPTPAELIAEVERLNGLHATLKAARPVLTTRNAAFIAELNKTVAVFRAAVAKVVQDDKVASDKALKASDMLSKSHHGFVPEVLTLRDEGLYTHVSQQVDDTIAALTEAFGHMAEGDLRGLAAKTREIGVAASRAHLAADEAGAYDDGEEE